MEDLSSYSSARKQTHIFQQVNSTLCKCCTSCLIPTFVAIVTSFLAFHFFRSTITDVRTIKSTMSTRNEVKGAAKFSAKVLARAVRGAAKLALVLELCFRNLDFDSRFKVKVTGVNVLALHIHSPSVVKWFDLSTNVELYECRITCIVYTAEHTVQPDAVDPAGSEILPTEIPWASFYLNQEEFYKGIYRIPWQQDNNGDTGVTLLDNVNFKIARKGLYEIYSKITIEFTRQPTQKYAYHNLSLNDTTGNTWVLEKNIITVPDAHRRTRRSFLISDLFLLRELNVGETIGVVVSNTSLVYHSKIDNTVKIIKRA